MDPYGDFPWRSVKLLGDEYYMLARFSFPTVMRYNPIELSAGLIMGNEATIIWSLKFRLIIHSLVLYSGWYHLSFSCTCFIAPFVSILSASSKVKKLLGGPMYAHASQWLRNSGFGLPQKNTTFSHVTLHMELKNNMPFQNRNIIFQPSVWWVLPLPSAAGSKDQRTRLPGRLHHPTRPLSAAAASKWHQIGEAFWWRFVQRRGKHQSRVVL